MQGRRWVWLNLIAALTLLIPGVLGWGKEGHYAVCKIAESYLSEEAEGAVRKLVPDGDLASVCSWPDQIRFHYRWSSDLHFVDTPDFRCNYEYCRDCHDSGGNKDRCVTGAINNYTTQLRTGYDNNLESQYNLTEALMFLSHFVGDVHQPLHAGFLGDLGGNSITVRWYRRKTNLHHVWDTMIIDSALKEFYDSDLATMIQTIQQNITNNRWNNVSSWGICANNETACPDPYASESINLACNFAYKNATPGTTLEDEYFLSRLPVVEERLAQGGVRLAATLNRIFSSEANIAEARRR